VKRAIRAGDIGIVLTTWAGRRTRHPLACKLARPVHIVFPVWMGLVINTTTSWAWWQVTCPMFHSLCHTVGIPYHDSPHPSLPPFLTHNGSVNTTPIAFKSILDSLSNIPLQTIILSRIINANTDDYYTTNDLFRRSLCKQNCQPMLTYYGQLLKSSWIIAAAC